MKEEPPPDRGETSFDMEPLIPEEASKHRPEVNDLALELSMASAELGAALPVSIRAPLAGLVRSMNSYHSNLIEGHDTHPIDVERALRHDFSDDPKTRDLQIEAVSPIEIHRRFCEGLPEDLLLQADEGGRTVRTEPGAFRTGFVRVGDHVPPSPGAVPRLLAHLHRMYRMQGRLGRVLFVACAHHRPVWVRPFPDMNGWVSRMVAHAMLHDLLKSEGLWSASRGLARNVDDYRARLAAADAKRPMRGGRAARSRRRGSRSSPPSSFDAAWTRSGAWTASSAPRSFGHASSTGRAARRRGAASCGAATGSCARSSGRASSTVAPCPACRA